MGRGKCYFPRFIIYQIIWQGINLANSTTFSEGFPVTPATKVQESFLSLASGDCTVHVGAFYGDRPCLVIDMHRGRATHASGDEVMGIHRGAETLSARA